ncbi:MAG: 2'-5' RNA ligase family protein [Nocardioidaceae bacterium]|nr:2'-5' RNA ligase family protein [Nocardioidaceae bacterium]
MPTIGVAIAIPEPWAGVLQQYRASFGDPAADVIPTHLTLVPPTPVLAPQSELDAHLCDVASRHAPFRLRLRGTATFRPVSPVVFVAVSEGISSCELLAEAARRGALEQEPAFPYHPHVTVAHHLDEAALDYAYATLRDFEASFEVTEFHLYIHGDDGVWRPVRTFELSAQTG